MHKKLLSLLLLLSSFSLHAQIGGRYVYEFLGNPQSARLTALGGAAIAVVDGDLNLAASNPALLDSLAHRKISLSHNFSFAGVSNGHLAYAHKIDKWDIMAHGGITYVSFGEFVGADELGNSNGLFSGGETAIFLGASKPLNERITAGVNIKGIFGTLENFSSNGIAADLGLIYQRPNSDLKIAFVVKNIGTELSAYGTEKGSTPLDIQIGISQKLKYLPFRFGITAHQLQQWGIRYDDPNLQETETLFGEEAEEESELNKEIDNFFRHLAFNGEFLLGRNQGFKIRFGYNHLRRQELSLSNFRSLAGFSGGFGLRIKGMQIDYGVGYHHLAGATNHLTIMTGLGRLLDKF